MIIFLNELKDNKDYWFEIELCKNNGGPQLDLIKSKECNSFQEIIDYINDLDKKEVISYYDLSLDYNNRKVKNIMNLDELTLVIRNNRPAF